MRQTKLNLAATQINGKRYWQVISPRLGGGRNRRTFKDREEAKCYYDLAKVQIQNFGNAAMSISDALRAEAVKCSQMLQPFGKTIADAAHFYVDHLQEMKRSQTVSHVVNELQSACKADGKSVRYLRDLKYRFGRFAEDFGPRHIAEITTADIDRWLRELNLGPVSRNTFRRRLVTLFKFAKTRGWCRTIPAAESARVREVADEVGILTPEELKGLLSVASEETLPYWAIGAFAGLRASEIERLDWSDVNLPALFGCARNMPRLPLADCGHAAEPAKMAAAVWEQNGKGCSRKSARETAGRPKARHRRRSSRARMAVQRTSSFLCVLLSCSVRRCAKAGVTTRAYWPRHYLPTLSGGCDTRRRKALLED